MSNRTIPNRTENFTGALLRIHEPESDRLLKQYSYYTAPDDHPFPVRILAVLTGLENVRAVAAAALDESVDLSKSELLGSCWRDGFDPAGQAGFSEHLRAAVKDDLAGRIDEAQGFRALTIEVPHSVYFWLQDLAMRESDPEYGLRIDPGYVAAGKLIDLFRAVETA